MNRRNFMSLVGLGAASSYPVFSQPKIPLEEKRVLVLGGTRFLGPVIVRELLAKGHSVTLFNRGKTNPGLFSHLPLIKGDRETEDGSGLKELAQNTQHWDWVVDTWRGSSKAVEDTARILVNRTNQYQYVSTVSVYDKWDRIGIREDEPLNPLPSESEPIISPNRYAIRKTFSERILSKWFPENSVMFRSHGLRGYPNSAPRHEPYWQVKVWRGRQLVAPGDIGHYQVTDMRSLAMFMVHAGERQLQGAFNVAYSPMLFRDFIMDIVRDTNSKVKLHWLPQEFLLKHDVKLIRTNSAGRYRFNVSKAVNAGLVNRPMVDLLNDQLQGYLDRNPRDDFNFGQPDTATISESREQEIIELWRRKSGG